MVGNAAVEHGGGVVSFSPPPVAVSVTPVKGGTTYCGAVIAMVTALKASHRSSGRCWMWADPLKALGSSQRHKRMPRPPCNCCYIADTATSVV